MQSVECSPLQVVPLRIYKRASTYKPDLARNDSTISSQSKASTSSNSTLPGLSASTSSSSTESSSSSSIQHTFGPPLSSLLQARQRHRARHASWQISAKLAVRAQQTYETLLYYKRETAKPEDVDEARIRLRIALEEEDTCRKKVDAAALEIMKLKRMNEERLTLQKQQQQSHLLMQPPDDLSTSGLCSPAFSSSSSTFGDLPVLPMTPTMPAMTFDLPQYYDEEEQEAESNRYSIHLKEVRRLTRLPAKLVHCSCGAACLCSAVSSLLE